MQNGDSPNTWGDVPGGSLPLLCTAAAVAVARRRHPYKGPQHSVQGVLNASLRSCMRGEVNVFLYQSGMSGRQSVALLERERGCWFAKGKGWVVLRQQIESGVLEGWLCSVKRLRIRQRQPDHPILPEVDHPGIISALANAIRLGHREQVVWALCAGSAFRSVPERLCNQQALSADGLHAFCPLLTAAVATRWTRGVELVVSMVNEQLLQAATAATAAHTASGSLFAAPFALHKSLLVAAARGGTGASLLLVEQFYRSLPAWALGDRRGELMPSLDLIGPCCTREVAQWLARHGSPRGSTANAATQAARQGNLALLEFFLKENDDDARTVHEDIGRCALVVAAAEGGSLQVTRWLLRHGHAASPAALIAAVTGGVSSNSVRQSVRDSAFALVEFLWLHYGEHRDASVLDAAAASQGDHRLDVVRFLSEHGAPCRFAMDEAARTPSSLSVVEYLHFVRDQRHGLSPGCSTDALDHAAALGSLEVVRFLVENRCEGGTVAALDQACGLRGCNGQNVAEFLFAHGFSCSHKALRNAVQQQNAALVRLVLAHTEQPQQQQQQSVHAMALACGLPSLEIVELLHEQCLRAAAQCAPLALDAAARHGQLHVIEFLIRRSLVARTGGATLTSVGAAAQGGHCHVLRFLLEEVGMAAGPLTESQKSSLLNRAVWGNLETCEYLVNRVQCPVDRSHIWEAEECAETGDIEDYLRAKYEEAYPFSSKCAIS